MRKSESQSKAHEDKGDRAPAEVFVELYEEYMPKVFRYMSYRTDDVSLAEDLTSEVFEKALTKLSSYRSDKASFSTWLFSIARNTVIDHYRVSSKKQTFPLEKAAEVSSDSSPYEEINKKEERQQLQLCLVGLSQQEQDIVSYKFGGEFNNRQIAKMLGLSESNVGTILYRTVRKLRDCFKGWQNEWGSRYGETVFREPRTHTGWQGS